MKEMGYKLDFVIFRSLAKVVDTFSKVIINECRAAFNLPLATDIIRKQNIIISWYVIVHL